MVSFPGIKLLLLSAWLQGTLVFILIQLHLYWTDGIVVWFNINVFLFPPLIPAPYSTDAPGFAGMIYLKNAVMVCASKSFQPLASAYQITLGPWVTA